MAEPIAIPVSRIAPIAVPVERVTPIPVPVVRVGERGEPGVGITSVDVNETGALVFSFTEGPQQEVTLPLTVNVADEVQEVALGEVNGVNATYTSTFPFNPDSLKVFDRVLLTQPDDYVNLDSSTIQLTFSPEPGEMIFLIYRKLLS